VGQTPGTGAPCCCRTAAADSSVGIRIHRIG
jgi:hypothetical protein